MECTSGIKKGIGENMTENTAIKKTEKKTKEPVIKLDDKGTVKPEAKDKVPVEVLALAKELKIDATTLLGWNVNDERVVIISANGMKFSSAIKR
jgi:hypothetical protein